MSIQKTARIIFITAFIIIVAASASFAAETPAKPGAAESKTVLTVGSETFNEAEILRLLMVSTDGDEMTVSLMLSMATLEKRREMVEQISEAILLAEAAKNEKLGQKPEIAFEIRWQTLQILLQAYFEQISSSWDFSEAAMRKYYNSRRAEFHQQEAVRASHILTETESDALIAMLEAMDSDFAAVATKYSRDPDTAQNGGDLGWVEKGMMVLGSVEEAIMNGRPGQTVGPVQSELGWHVIKIGEHRTGKQLSFEQAQGMVLSRMQDDSLAQEFKKLKVKFPVTINDEALGMLGGIPALMAPEPAK